MKTLKFTLCLFCLTLFSGVGYSQTLKYFQLNGSQTLVSLNQSNIKDALKFKLSIPNSYMFELQTINGTSTITEFQDDLGFTHERYSQYYKGIKVENSDIRVHYQNDIFVSANGEYIDVSYIDTSVILSPSQAIQYAKTYVNAEKYMWEDASENQWLQNVTNDSLASFYPIPEIVICKNFFDLQDTTLHIAYKMIIYAKKPISRDYIYVDAKTGNILCIDAIIKNINASAATRYSGTRIISKQQNGASYRLRDYNRGNGIETYNMHKGTSYLNATDFTDADNNWTAAEFHNIFCSFFIKNLFYLK